jgi:hypothetical protein
MTNKEYSSYIKGLMDGSAFDTTTPEGKIISALVNLVDQMAGEIETLTEALDTAKQYIEEIDEDLGYVEDIVYDDEDDDDCCCDCCGCDDEEEDEDEDDEDEEEEFFCAMCPGCNGKVYFDDTVNPEDVICPNCGEALLDEEDESVEV